MCDGGWLVLLNFHHTTCTCVKSVQVFFSPKLKNKERDEGEGAEGTEG